MNKIAQALLAVAALLAVGGLSACGGAASEPEAASVAAAPAPSFGVLGEFTNARGFRNLYVRVPAGLDDAALIAVAEAVHRQQPDAWLFLFDDDAEIGALLAALPQIEQGQGSGSFPRDWYRQHLVATSVLMLQPDGKRPWVLYRGDRQQELATLPCIDGAGHCR